MPYAAAIFDMDGTILDTLGDMHASVNAVLRAEGYPERTLEEIRAFVGNGAKKLIDRSLPPDTAEAERARILDLYRAYYDAHADILTTPYAGLPEALAALKAAGVRLGVATNKPEQTALRLAGRYYPGVFDIVLGDRAGRPRKPSPAGVNEALASLGVPAGRAVYVGDSDVDIRTAEAAGTACLSVTWGFRDEAFLAASGAKTLVRSPAALVTAIMG